jgi:hypothetical protein
MPTVFLDIVLANAPALALAGLFLWATARETRDDPPARKTSVRGLAVDHDEIPYQLPRKSAAR